MNVRFSFVLVHMMAIIDTDIDISYTQKKLNKSLQRQFYSTNADDDAEHDPSPGCPCGESKH